MVRDDRNSDSHFPGNREIILVSENQVIGLWNEKHIHMEMDCVVRLGWRGL